MDSATLPTLDRMGELLGELPESLFPPSFVTSVDLVEQYGEDWTLELAHRLELGEVLTPGATAEEVAARRGFVPAFRPALGWLLGSLAATGHLEMEEAGDPPRYRLRAPLRRAELDRLRRETLAADPANAPTLDLLDTAGNAYPEVAAGRRKGEEVLLGPAGAALWASYFRNDNPVYAINNHIAAIAAANRLPATGPVRILELGAGGGSGSEALLAELGQRGLAGRLSSFQVTEPSPFFRRRCQRSLTTAFPQAPLVFGELDMDRPWREQGVEPGSVDLIYGVNVLHVADDLVGSLRQAYEALAPGGWLAAGECLRPFPGQPVSAEMVFYLLEAFTAVATDPEIRPNPGFLTPGQWRTCLGRAGFQDAATVPDVERIRHQIPRFLSGAVCGRRPD